MIAWVQGEYIEPFMERLKTLIWWITQLFRRNR